MKKVVLFSLLLLAFEAFSQEKKVVKGYTSLLKDVALIRDIDNIKSIRNIPLTDIDIEVDLHDYLPSDLLVFKILSTKKDYIYIIFDVRNFCLVHCGGFGNSTLEIEGADKLFWSSFLHCQ